MISFRSFVVASAIVSIPILSPIKTLAEPYPDLYPNAHYKTVGQEKARQDIGACTIAANEYLQQQGGGNSGRKDVARGAARGAAAGALAATIMDQKAGRGAGAGAAVGGLKAVSGNRQEKRDGSPEYRQYVEACLEDKGYKVVGWKTR